MYEGEHFPLSLAEHIEIGVVDYCVDFMFTIVVEEKGEEEELVGGGEGGEVGNKAGPFLAMHQLKEDLRSPKTGQEEQLEDESAESIGLQLDFVEEKVLQYREVLQNEISRERV